MLNEPLLQQMKKNSQSFHDSIRETADYQAGKEAFDIEYTIAEIVHKARKEAELTQKELAEKMHTSQSVISRIENGSKGISIGKLAEYAQACGKHLKVEFV